MQLVAFELYFITDPCKASFQVQGIGVQKFVLLLSKLLFQIIFILNL